MTYQTILVESAGGVTTITLNRPAAGNALNTTMLEELDSALQEAREAAGWNVVVLTGAGESFCVGGDASDSGLAGKQDLLKKIVLTLAEMDKPCLVALNGPAVGAGCSLALAGDMILASEQASFGELLTVDGPLPDVGGAHFLPRLVGVGRARELAALPGPIEVALADKLGMVNRVVPAGELAGAARELAEKIAAGPPIAITYSKRIMSRAFEMTLSELLEYEALSQQLIMSTRDHQEAGKAFLEKRPVKFIGQ
ncbi:MAG: 2-(1,2-epoxy-1,2-dihydrophenyl)acetyl-CoA isomerase [Chloroflexota bacterium]|nr:MAG: 2-(1,2-epoxy-1,2-dihydrophenyl)acetyl-CoA isomerase [Chloroflexota bacterium]